MRRSLTLGCLLGVTLVAPARAIEVEILSQLPATTRVLMLVQPEALRTVPDIATLLQTDAHLTGTWARLAPPAKVARIAIAFVAAGEAREKVVVTLGKTPWTSSDLEGVRGPKLATTGSGAVIHALEGSKEAWLQASPRCILEGKPQVLATIAKSTQHLAGLETEKPAARLLAESDSGWPAVVVQVSPEEPVDMHAILQEIDRTLSLRMEPFLGSYKTALRLLGSAHGLRVAMRRQENAYEAGVVIAMPNRMAAQIASVSLEAGAGMALNASDAAVKAGKMSREDAMAVAAVLTTLRSRPDGDLVQVTVAMRDSSVSP